MLSSIGFIFFKNETIGVGYCAACLTTFLFGLYIYEINNTYKNFYT